ncbi:hypothetical protein QCN29_14905 [Streptomyces sp. HNM0663]|uniref:Uncharacterized protein n=1 Tax=Streptomyces chengmaiensis TaxID=3040919 RepID=A0ABT6HMY4_9ACTN|nr:hypothetical protein [Streptomyces chengmaiensis]MDH2390057.1 hypothetical protein [Streptomyces chengmaiensis]
MNTTTMAAPVARRDLDVSDPGEVVWPLWAAMTASGEWFRRAGKA